LAGAAQGGMTSIQKKGINNRKKGKGFGKELKKGQKGPEDRASGVQESGRRCGASRISGESARQQKRGERGEA